MAKVEFDFEFAIGDVVCLKTGIEEALGWLAIGRIDTSLPKAFRVTEHVVRECCGGAQAFYAFDGANDLMAVDAVASYVSAIEKIQEAVLGPSAARKSHDEMSALMSDLKKGVIDLKKGEAP